MYVHMSVCMFISKVMELGEERNGDFDGTKEAESWWLLSRSNGSKDLITWLC